LIVYLLTDQSEIATPGGYEEGHGQGAGRDHHVGGRLHHRPERRPGLGVGGERLHYWVFGGPWGYDSPERGQPNGEDKAWLEDTLGANGAVAAGRGTYEAAGHWGEKNPWGIPLFVVTHRPEEQPPGDDFVFVGGIAVAIDQAKAAAGGKHVHVMGGSQIIRQTLAAGLIDELTIIIAPVVLGGGKRFFEGYTGSLELEHVGLRQSPFATFIDYRVRKAT
jgi:dihydrofolate reductase